MSYLENSKGEKVLSIPDLMAQEFESLQTGRNCIKFTPVKIQQFQTIKLMGNVVRIGDNPSLRTWIMLIYLIT